jgi:hypothetical protein
MTLSNVGGLYGVGSSVESTGAGVSPGDPMGAGVSPGDPTGAGVEGFCCGAAVGLPHVSFHVTTLSQSIGLHTSVMVKQVVRRSE